MKLPPPDSAVQLWTGEKLPFHSPAQIMRILEETKEEFRMVVTTTRTVPTQTGDALFVVEGIRVFVPLFLSSEDATRAMKRINARINDYLTELADTEKQNGSA